MKILLTGANGQLGKALQKCKPFNINLISCSRSDLDLSDLTACTNFVKAHSPDWVINTAAYTAVDRAEEDSSLAMLINASASEALADGLVGSTGRFLQISTDFVFNGLQSSPYSPDDLVDPISVYGKSKALAETKVIEKLGRTGRAHILRTSWIYGPVGKNFCLTMLRLHTLKFLEGKPLEVVVDQVGCPTSTKTLATTCWALINQINKGKVCPSILHWSDAGVASWYDFAMAIGELGVSSGLLNQAAEVKPIQTVDYPTAAKRPPYSVLDITKTSDLLDSPPVHWRNSLKVVLDEIKSLGES